MPIATRRLRASTIPFIILLNFAVFTLWVFFGSQPDGPMAQHFLVSWQSLSEGRLWTLLTSAFSHNMLWHFLINMLVLNSFGPIVEVTLGPRFFLHFYIVAGLVSSLSHALVSNWIMNAPELPALGASGAISGVVLLFSLLFPRERIAIFGLIPVPALLGAIAFIGLDLWGLIAQAGGGGLPIGHGAHLGGAFTGIYYYFFIIRPRLRRKHRVEIL